MTPRRQTNNPLSDLRHFEQNNSHNGKFLRYCQGRIDAFFSRQIMMGLGILIVAFIVNPMVALICAVIVALGELVDCLFFLKIMRDRTVQTVRASDFTISNITAIFQTLSVSLCLATPWVTAGADIRFYIIVFLAGATLNSGVAWRYNSTAISIRFIIYTLTAAGLFLYDAMLYGIGSKPLIKDFFATLILIYILKIFIEFIRRNQSSRERSEHAMLQERQKSSIAIVALQEKERETRQLAEVAQNSNDAIIFLTPTGKISWVNRTFTELFGHRPIEVVGKDPDTLLTGPDTSQRTLKKLRLSMQKERSIRVDIQLRKQNNRMFWVDTVLTPLADTQGKLHSFVSVSRDITQSKKQMAALKKARANAENSALAKSTFLATMSHEIRTPMNGIIGMSDLLRQTELTVEQQDYVDTIVGSGDALLQIINDILDFSKLDAGKLHIATEPMNIHKNLHSVVSIIGPNAAEKSIDLSLNIDKSVPEWVIGDDGRIRQIVLNLISNAVKFTETGSVRVSASSHKKQRKNIIEIAIHDSGIGIPADMLGHIFERFTQAEENTTRKFGGTGLGLSISHLLATQMGGEIKVTSALGQGSCFTLKLSLKNAKSGAHSQVKIATENTVMDLKNTHILVAEDNRTNQLLLRKMLENQVGRLEFAENGEEVVDKFIKAPPDVVLMDVSMPKKNGMDATKDIRIWEQKHNHPRIPIIALTANAFPEDRKKCLNSGMTGFLEKPIKKQRLLDELSQTLQQSA
jgi:PAS domain S-box-containing protein